MIEQTNSKSTTTNNQNTTGKTSKRLRMNKKNGWTKKKFLIFLPPSSSTLPPVHQIFLFLQPKLAAHLYIRCETALWSTAAFTAAQNEGQYGYRNRSLSIFSEHFFFLLAIYLFFFQTKKSYNFSSWTIMADGCVYNLHLVKVQEKKDYFLSFFKKYSFL